MLVFSEWVLDVVLPNLKFLVILSWEQYLFFVALRSMDTDPTDDGPGGGIPIPSCGRPAAASHFFVRLSAILCGYFFWSTWCHSMSAA